MGRRLSGYCGRDNGSDSWDQGQMSWWLNSGVQKVPVI